MSSFRFIFIVFTCFQLKAQKVDINDSIYRIANQSLYNDISKSDELTHFLLKHTSPDIEQKSLLHHARIEYLKGNYLEGIQSLYGLKKLMTGSSDPYISMELARYYESLGLLAYAKKQIGSLEQFSFPSFYLYKSETERDQKIKSKLLHKGLHLNLQNDDENIPQLKEQFYLELGNNHKDKDSAIYYYNLILNSLNNNQANVLYNKALISLNDLFFRQKNAIDSNSLGILLSIKQNELDFESKIKLNDLLSKYYYSTNNIGNYKTTIKEKNRLDSIYEINSIKARNFIISESYVDNSYNDRKNNDRIYYAMAVLALFFIGIILYFRLKLIQKRTKIQLDYLKEKNNEPSLSDSNEEQNSKNITPEKTELELLKKLEEFEVSGKFLDKHISLPNLAEQLETNIRYLSEIINKNKNKNFNQYVNELRINYIIFKMKNEPKYLNYKIQALADECGFSSLSVFSVTFKSVTGVSPTAYAKNIKERNDD